MKIGIIGCGAVGSTAAYAMVMRGVGREIIMIDQNNIRATAEANDILHAVPFAHDINIRAGNYADLEGCRVAVITAGVAQNLVRRACSSLSGMLLYSNRSSLPY
jgi:L-lactate dehydrogenase